MPGAASVVNLPSGADPNYGKGIFSSGGLTNELLGLVGTTGSGRDAAIINLINQYKQPLQNLYENQGVSQAVQNYRANQYNRLTPLAQQGLLQSGAANISRRGLNTAYAGDVQNAVISGQSQENQRRQAILAALQGIATGDVQNVSTLGAGTLGTLSADANRQLADFVGNSELAKGSASLLATIAGGVAGAYGAGAGSGAGYGGGTGGASGAALGALQASNTASQLGGGYGGGANWNMGPSGTAGGMGYSSPSSNPYNPSGFSLFRGPGSIASPNLAYKSQLWLGSGGSLG